MKKTTWQNRIIKTDMVPAVDFLPNEQNWRVHPQPQQTGLTAVLDDIGWVQRVIVNLRTSEEWGRNQGIETMVDGHLRVKLALSKNDQTPVPVDYVDLTPNEEAIVLATLDPIAAMAATDRDMLSGLMATIQIENEEISKMLAAIRETNTIFDQEQVEFKEFGDDAADDVQYNECPSCGHRWIKG